jgi:TPR repeat protein
MRHRLPLTLLTLAGLALPGAPAPVAAQARGPIPTPWASLQRRRGQRWAVVIGISQYADPKVGNLRYANRDARALYDFLLSDRAGLDGFKRENVRLLVDETATTHNIRAALREFLKGATADDVVYIYFAGHGAPDPDRLDDLYLLAYDTKIDSIASTGVPMTDVSEATRRIRAQDLIVLVDACHSAGVGERGGFRGPITNDINRTFLTQLASAAPSYATITASEKAQLSQEDPRWGGGHGVFTHYLLEGLNGAADSEGDGNNDQIVTLGELFEYVRRHVSRDTRSAQVPTISQTQYDRNWPMSVVPAPAVGGPATAPPPPPSPTSGATERTRSAASDLAERGETEFQVGAFAAALEPLTRACQAGNARSCSALGLMYLDGLGVPTDFQHAFDLLRSSCTANDGRGCNGVGLLYSQGIGVKRDKERAAEFYQRACDHDYSSGCSNAADDFLTGTGGLARDSARARELNRRAFELASAACTDTGVECVTLGSLYVYGRLGDTSYTKGADYFTRACRGGAGQGCWYLGVMTANAQGMPRDSSRALDFQMRACDLGNGVGCLMAGRWGLLASRTAGDSLHAIPFYERGCALSTSTACVELGFFLSTGRIVAADQSRAFTLFQKSCELGDGWGCYDLGTMYQSGYAVAADPTRAGQLYRDACDQRVGPGCGELANLHEAGTGVPQDLAKALELNQLGCDYGNAAACSNLARFYSGVVSGIPADSARAALARKRACELSPDCKP